MTISTLTSKGQATIPKAIREYLGVKPSGRILFTIEEGKVIIQKAGYSTSESAGVLREVMSKPFPSIGEIDAVVAEERARRYKGER